MTEKVKKMYSTLDRAIDLIRTSPDSWKSYLSFAAGIYKYGFSDSLLIYVQKPAAPLANGKCHTFRQGDDKILLPEESEAAN